MDSRIIVYIGLYSFVDNRVWMLSTTLGVVRQIQVSVVESVSGSLAVSYTHLDVYKRQVSYYSRNMTKFH